ncbi:MFS transporter [Sphaerisporangium sp. NPDC005289]|uniref:MFS transporter n=1 Tax=Sphaerisporangium sp. NPDC005289 TaxID=3155247 RepID=UPI0033B24C81
MIELLPLRRQRDYRLLWSARAVSETGTEVSRLAVPLTAAALLNATPVQMGLLTAATSLPYLLIGLPAGAYADRLRRHRPLLVLCEVVSGAAVLTVPLGWLAGLLTVPWLITVALVIGTCSVFYRAAWFPHLPSVVAREQRTAAIAGFQMVYSTAGICGPGLAGLLVQAITAPLALVADAASFAVSALLLHSLRSPETATTSGSTSLTTPESTSSTAASDSTASGATSSATASHSRDSAGTRSSAASGTTSGATATKFMRDTTSGTDTSTEIETDAAAEATIGTRTSLLQDTREGMLTVMRHGTLRTLIGAGVLINFASAAQMALLVLFTVRTLGMQPGAVGLLVAASGVGGLLGAVTAPRLTGRLTEDRTILIAVALFPLEFVAIASAHGSAVVLVPLLMGAFAVSGMAAVLFSVCYGTIQLRESPPDMLGRVNATMTVSTLGVMTLGGVAGGVLGEFLGLRPTMWACAFVVLLAVSLVWSSPLRHALSAPHRPTPA